jgi:hypothetical protein
MEVVVALAGVGGMRLREKGGRRVITGDGVGACVLAIVGCIGKSVDFLALKKPSRCCYN